MANVNKPCPVAGFDLPAWCNDCNVLIGFWFADDAFYSVKPLMERLDLFKSVKFRIHVFFPHRIDIQYGRNVIVTHATQLPLVQLRKDEHSRSQPSSGAHPRATPATRPSRLISTSIICTGCILLLSLNIFHPLIHLLHTALRNLSLALTCTCANVFLRLSFFTSLCPTFQHGSVAFPPAFDV